MRESPPEPVLNVADQGMPSGDGIFVFRTLEALRGLAPRDGTPTRIDTLLAAWEIVTRNASAKT